MTKKQVTARTAQNEQDERDSPFRHDGGGHSIELASEVEDGKSKPIHHGGGGKKKGGRELLA